MIVLGQSMRLKFLLTFLLGGVVAVFIMFKSQDLLAKQGYIPEREAPPAPGPPKRDGPPTQTLYTPVMVRSHDYAAVNGTSVTVTRRYRDCNQSNILCGGDATMDSVSLEDSMAQFKMRVLKYTYTCKKRKRFGKAGDGGYEICMDDGVRPPHDDCIVYSFGINNEWSFDEAVRKTLGCEVHSFDPSMNKPDHEHKAGIHFHNLGVWGKDTNNSLGWELNRISTIKDKLGHSEAVIDVLKIDVEGAEWPTLRDMFLTGDLYNVRQLILEIHTPNFLKTDKPMSVRDLAEVHNYYTSLKELNFQLYYRRDRNGCCGRFHDLVKIKGYRKCCFETFLLNNRFIVT